MYILKNVQYCYACINTIYGEIYYMNIYIEINT
jgi:hypothetical protein